MLQLENPENKIQDPGERRVVEHNHTTKQLRNRGECPACDEYHENNPGSTSGRRAALAAEYLMSLHDSPYSREECAAAAAKFGSGRSSTYRAISIGARSKEIFNKVKRGELSIAEGSRLAGFIEYRLGSAHVPTGGFFGKGDKFWEVMNPLTNYLRSWEARGYEFKHLAPKEAKRRAKRLQEVEERLELVRKDLALRSDDTTLALVDKGQH